MTEETIREALYENLKTGIQKVISGELTEYKSSFLSPDDIISELVSMGGDDSGEMDSNGWQWDFWQTVELDGVSYGIGGSGYYGGIRFYKQP
jgi:hypothetical protein